MKSSSRHLLLAGLRDGRAEAVSMGSLRGLCRPDRRRLAGHPLRVSHLRHWPSSFSGLCLGRPRESARGARARSPKGRWLVGGLAHWLGWLGERAGLARWAVVPCGAVWCRAGGPVIPGLHTYAYPASPACPPGRPSGGLLEGVWKVEKSSIVGPSGGLMDHTTAGAATPSSPWLLCSPPMGVNSLHNRPRLSAPLK